MLEDRGPLVAAIQFAISCSGLGPVTVDGVFGPKTEDAVKFAQLDLGMDTTGEPTQEFFDELSRDCSDPRPVTFRSGTTTLELVGNAAGGDDEVFSIGVLRMQELTVEVDDDSDVEVLIEDPDGGLLGRSRDKGSISADIDETGTYQIRVRSEDVVTFAISVTVPPPDVGLADIVLRGDGLQLVSFGDPANEVITFLGWALGPAAEDTGWIDDEACHGGAHRRISWQLTPPTEDGIPSILRIHFTDYDADARVFTDYRYSRGFAPEAPAAAKGALSTRDGLTLGSSTAAIEAVFPAAEYLYQGLTGDVVADLGGALPGFWIWPAIEVGPDTDLTNLAGWIAAIGMGQTGCPELE